MEEDRIIEQARTAIASQRGELTSILNRVAKDRDTTSARERLKRWREQTIRILRAKVNDSEADAFQSKRKGSFIMGQPLRNFADEVKMYDGFLTALDEEIVARPDTVFIRPVPEELKIEVKTADASSRSVFIIHGHDELNVLRLKELIRDRWKLEPIVLSAEPGKGRTIIEKFEQEAQRAIFAFGLFSPDDSVKTASGEYTQARPNAVFELGWFYGRLGRERVCMLVKKGTVLHSDLSGISRIDYDESIKEKVSEIESELVAVDILKK